MADTSTGPIRAEPTTTRITDRSAGLIRAEAAPPPDADRLICALILRRERVAHAFFTAEAARLASLCHRMAERFARGGRLIACGMSPLTRSDARHIAVEFVHPVIVGKRALPAIGLTADGGTLPGRLAGLVRPDDLLVVFDDEPPGSASGRELRGVVAAARRMGALTLSFGPLGAEWELDPPTSCPFVRQELIEVLYHVLWELVHVFFEHPGLLERGRTRDPSRIVSPIQGAQQAPGLDSAEDRAHRHNPRGTADDGGASSFLYPFLGETERNLAAVLDDVRRSVLMKSTEVEALRRQTDVASRRELLRAAKLLRDAFANGGSVLALGNGGSATDAMDAVADFLYPPHGWRSRRALELTEDASILTAIANDVGVDLIFARQIIAYGRPGDVVLAFTTSGGSRNIIAALEEARRRGLATIAFVGYDGGPIRERNLADVVVLARSQNIPRIQEAHATAFHILRELVETEIPAEESNAGEASLEGRTIAGDGAGRVRSGGNAGARSILIR